MENNAKKGAALPAAERNYDLIAFDLDGTVFDSPTNQVLSERVVRALRAAHEAGAVIAVASGRPTWMLGDELPGAPWLDWAITCNGARVSGVHAVGDDIAAAFPRPLACKVLEAVHEFGGTMSIHTNRSSLMENAQLRSMSKRFAEEAGDEGSYTGNPIENLLATFGGVAVESGVEAFAERTDDQLDKIDCTLPSADAANALEARLEELGGVDAARLGSYELELTAKGASKGEACEALCRRLGIEVSRTVAFGDSGNDLSMAGRELTFVAMGNATDEVKAAADAIADPVTEDGVATWLEANLLA